MTRKIDSKDCKGQMNEDYLPRNNFEFFTISFTQITILIFCYILLMVLSQFTIATVALQNRIPDEVVDMNDEEKKAFQEKTVKEFEVIIKNNPEKMKQEYLEAITNTTPSLLFVQNILWLVCFVIPMYFFFNKVIRVKVNGLLAYFYLC